MRRTLVLLLLIAVILTVTTSVVLAKPGKKMELVCWVKTAGGEQSAYFMMTGSGIVQRWKEDGQHDIYMPKSKFDMPDGDGWASWTAKAHDPCANPTAASHADYLPVGTEYWHRHN